MYQVSEGQIKRQYHSTVRIQQKQYKALQKQMIATVPKERHREVMRQTKEEQMRKIAMLALQYERTIADMAQKQTVSGLIEQQNTCTVGESMLMYSRAMEISTKCFHVR